MQVERLPGWDVTILNVGIVGKAFTFGGSVDRSHGGDNKIALEWICAA